MVAVRESVSSESGVSTPEKGGYRHERYYRSIVTDSVLTCTIRVDGTVTTPFELPYIALLAYS